MTYADPRRLTDRAVNIAKDKSQENFVERWGGLSLPVRFGGTDF